MQFTKRIFVNIVLYKFVNFLALNKFIFKDYINYTLITLHDLNVYILESLHICGNSLVTFNDKFRRRILQVMFLKYFM